MHILYVINSVEGGGAALPVPSIVETLIANGAQVTVAALTRRDGRAIAAIEATGVRALKVRHNNILGFYIEVSQGSAKPLQSAVNDSKFGSVPKK